MHNWSRLLVTVLATTFLCACSSLNVQPEEHVSATDESSQPGEVKVTFLGTTTLLIEDGTTRILIDGFLTRPPLPEVISGPIETNKALVSRILTDIGATKIDAIFVTHSHYDHALDVAFIAEKTGAVLYGSESTLNIGRGWPLHEDRLVRFNRDSWISIGTFRVRIYLSKHSPPIPFVNDDLGENVALPLNQPARESQYVEGGSFDILIAHGTNTMLVKGSANYLKGALRNVHADAIFLPIGGVGFRGETFHRRYYENTVGCVKPSVVVVTHWDSLFAPLSNTLPPMAGSGITLSHIRTYLKEDGIPLKILQGFETIRPFTLEYRRFEPPPLSIGCDIP
ncbi:L-ascorbate metabolism protein UlaG, beta-lactamase superfamily [Paraburkholderia steynii]|uniref:L-ascorbate metabolism protein UlaG, beta-lactamase superfamily n=1 Tax=Paraburkholderia steynii TaxID=1245441 RepID=A0A7Z7B5X4_9BURK|nr:MBL fold metallo-hydrolase [Paraburkholderia steynii]SDH78304.1 L-ascorbate metabolism protein UlaG, beta-lactamase superfamily [Paraburkholderia steynii]